MTPRPAEPGVKVFIDHKTVLTLDDSPNMKDRYKDYETTCAQIRQENALLLDDFVARLRGQRLASGTIRKHLENVEFFINEFLLCHDATRPVEGIGEISEFLGDWFIRKAMWSTPRYIKASATSLYKFYDFLAASDKITLAELAELKGTIAQHLAEWQARCQRYNDGDIDDWRGIG
jgi:hypothetical protein